MITGNNPLDDRCDFFLSFFSNPMGGCLLVIESMFPVMPSSTGVIKLGDCFSNTLGLLCYSTALIECANLNCSATKPGY